MPKLNQIIAVEKGSKSTTDQQVTEATRLLQKPEVFLGLSRTYTPKDEDGEVLPAETQNPVERVKHLLDVVAEAQTRVFDVTATKVYANTKAVADVVVDGKRVLAAVPVEYLLFLEKRLAELASLLNSVPTLDPALDWHFDPARDLYVTNVVRTTRSKKILRNHVVAEATKEHPAQVQVYTEDETVGYWDMVRFSGALPAARLNEMRARVAALQAAVKMAREEANSADAPAVEIGKKVFDHLFNQ